MKAVNHWLLTLLVAIAGIVIVGGITRLTDSGLSMVNWRPILGIFPPITMEQWQFVFDAYKQSPEYRTINHGMPLSEFKIIFFWEYFHRILGRLIGLIAVLPYAYFLVTGTLSKKFALRWPLVIGLIAAQGFLGWYMVKSGLIGQASVSHFRLSAHLLMAMVIFVVVLWQWLCNRYPKKRTRNLVPNWLFVVAIVPLILQIMYGAFVAGLDAGHYFNTYPKMGNQWIPPSIWMFPGFFNNILNNPIMVQWLHRWLAFVVVLTALIVCQFIYRFTHHNDPIRRAITAYSVGILFQVIIGISTLLSLIWLPLGVLHQLMGLFLVCVITITVFHSKYLT